MNAGALEMHSLPESITTIEAYAFKNCDNVKFNEFTISDNVTYIGKEVFNGAINLRKLTIPFVGAYRGDDVDSDTSLDSTAFGWLFGLKPVIGFALNRTINIYNEYVTEVHVTDDTIISNNAFENFTGITTLTINEGVTVIGESAFRNTGITSFVIPSSVESIGAYAFYDSSDLRTVKYNANINFDTLETSVFENCESLYSFTNTSDTFVIDGNINTIKDYAFKNTAFTYVNVPVTVTTTGTETFAYNNHLLNVDVYSANLGTYMFTECHNLEKAYLHANLTSIAVGTFMECHSLTKLNSEFVFSINSTVTTIEEYAFYGLRSLTDLNIPTNVTTIEDYAFAGNENIKSITIPSTVTSIGDKAFEGCSNIEIVKIAEGNAKYDSRENCNGIIDKTTSTLIKTFKNTTIPSTITTIGAYAFANNTSLTKISLPNNITTVENNAFESCVNVTTLELSENLKSIGYQAFKGLAIESLNIPMSVNNISVRAFEGCNDLFIVKVDAKNETYASYHNNGIVEKSTNALIMGTAETELDSSLSTVKQFAFYGSNIKSITVPASMTSLEAGAFAGCEKLVSLKVESGNSVYEDRGLNAVIEKSTNTIVAGCNMTSFDKSIKRIGAYAFAGSGIKGSTIGYLPNSITEICEYAFAYCNGGGTINVAKATEIIGAHAFKDSNFYIYFMWRMKPGEQFHADWNSSNCYTNIS